MINAELKNHIKSQEPTFLEKARKKGYVCPVCGNGTGNNGTGLELDRADGEHYKCFKCGLYADVFELYGIKYGISNFQEQQEAAAAYYGTFTTKAIECPRKATRPPVDYSDFYRNAGHNLAHTDYKRCISDATLHRFNIGYVEQWKHPKTPKATPTPRLIIPTSSSSYVARYAADTVPESARRYEKVGKTHIFNFDVLSDDSRRPVFIVEGEIDALSIADLDADAVAVGSASYIDRFRRELQRTPTHRPLILVPDNDAAGLDAFEKLQRQLHAASVPCTIATLPGEFKDANEMLRTDRQALAAFIQDALKQAAKPELLPTNDDWIQAKLQELRPETYDLNDKGNGELFADVFRNSIRWNTTKKEWCVYNGKVWLEDAGGMAAARKAKELSRELIIYAGKLEDDVIQGNYLKHVAKLGSLKSRKNMLEDAKSECYIADADFDQDDYLLNVQNGVIDLTTFKLLEHTPDLLLSKICNAEFDVAAAGTTWNRFIAEVMQDDAEKIEYLQKACGYALTGDTREDKCFILYGKLTRNGKSTMLESIAYMLGNTKGYAMNTTPETLAQKNNKDSRQASGDVARLDGCRFLNASEPPKRMILDAGLLKQMTGHDTITARHLHQSEKEFIPKFKLFINTNYLPTITDDSLFTSNRLIVISFDRHFEEHEQDKTLKDKLRSSEEMSGILNWCLDGLRKYYADGLKTPATIKNATAAYREKSDKIGNFIADELEPDTGSSISLAALYAEYQVWCEMNGYGCEGKLNFRNDFETRLPISKTGTVNGQTIYNVLKGYKIKPSAGVNKSYV